MEEQKKNHEWCGGSGNCGGWCGGMGGHGKHFLLKWALGLFILASVFWVGMKVGELKSLLRSEFGYGSRQYMMQGYNSGYPMMNWRTPKTTVPATQ